MKTAYFLFILTLIYMPLSFSQINVNILSKNNCSGTISDVGEFFNNPFTSAPSYEVPKGSGKHVIYSTALWFTGKDVNGGVKLTAPRYYPNSQDIWPGALTTGGAATLPSPNPLGQTLWTVSKSEIINHINNFWMPGYTIPNDILTWPAHGSTAAGQDYFLAPFVDLDANGDYNPELGEYPCIKGDLAIYTIGNDKGNIHGSGGDPIGLEIHYMFYQYDTPPLDFTTFLDVRVINRGTQTIYDYVNTFFMDFDIGSPMDDFMGCDSTRNLLYGYNGSAFDPGGNGVFGYDSLPPAIGLVCLTDTVNSMGAFSNGAAFPNGDPSSPVEYFNVMHGTYVNGTPWLDNNSQPTNFQYPGDPNNPTEWSEYSSGNASGDRRAIMSIEKPAILLPFQEYDMSFAFVFAQGTDNINSVTELFQQVDTVQYYFDNILSSDCLGGNVGILELSKQDFSIYPNPNNGTFILKSEIDLSGSTITIQSISGRQVWKGEYADIPNGELTLNEPSGMYFVIIENNNQYLTKRIIIE